jgi:hypothetical protein
MKQAIFHENIPVIEVADPLILDDLYADPYSARYLLTRLGPTIAVVAPDELDSLLARLLKLGHTPKILEC